MVLGLWIMEQHLVLTMTAILNLGLDRLTGQQQQHIACSNMSFPYHMAAALWTWLAATCNLALDSSLCQQQPLQQQPSTWFIAPWTPYGSSLDSNSGLLGHCSTPSSSLPGAQPLTQQ